MMSVNIPFEVQVEIIKRFPVKSLIQFRSVSKRWKWLIDSPEFIATHHHRVNQTQPHNLLVMFPRASGYQYVSIVDDDSFPHHKFCPAVTPDMKPLCLPTLLGCSHGLVCFFNCCKTLIVLWNPSIRKSVRIVVPSGVCALGFGLCPRTFDPKLVRLARTIRGYEAAVFTLSSGAWRTISMNLCLSNGLMGFSDNAVDIDGVIHWLVHDIITDNNRIVSFDLTTEEFGQVDLPDSLAGFRRHLDISKLKESLVVLEYCKGDAGEAVCDVWMMLKNSSFTKLFTLKDVWTNMLVGFRKNGQPIDGTTGELKVYEPGAKRMNGLGIYGMVFKMASYTESLLLLNHPDSIIE